MPRFLRRLAEGVFDLDNLKLQTGDLANFVASASHKYGLDGRQLVAVGCFSPAVQRRDTTRLFLTSRLRNLRGSSPQPVRTSPRTGTLAVANSEPMT